MFGPNPTWQMWALLLFVTENIFMYSWNSDVRVKSRDWVCKILLYKVWTLIERRRGSGVDVREGFSTFCTSLHIHMCHCTSAPRPHWLPLRLRAEIKIISSVTRSLSDPFPLIPDSLRCAACRTTYLLKCDTRCQSISRLKKQAPSRLSVICRREN